MKNFCWQNGGFFFKAERNSDILVEKLEIAWKLTAKEFLIYLKELSRSVSKSNPKGELCGTNLVNL